MPGDWSIRVDEDVLPTTMMTNSEFSCKRDEYGTYGRGKRWEATTVALIKPSRLSLAAQERKKAKEKLLAAIYLRALTDPYSFRDRRRSVEGSNACWSRSRLRFLFHETPRPCDRDGRSCFIRKAFLDEGEKGLLEAREASSSPIVSFICARNTRSPFFSLLFRVSNTRKRVV